MSSAVARTLPAMTAVQAIVAMGTFALSVLAPQLGVDMRLLGFIDAGWLGSNSPESFGKPTSDHLASLGLGLRYGKGPLILSLDYGRLVLGSKVPQAANSAAPEKGDDKLYFNLALRF